MQQNVDIYEINRMTVRCVRMSQCAGYMSIDSVSMTVCYLRVWV